MVVSNKSCLIIWLAGAAAPSRPYDTQSDAEDHGEAANGHGGSRMKVKTMKNPDGSVNAGGSARDVPSRMAALPARSARAPVGALPAVAALPAGVTLAGCRFLPY